MKSLICAIIILTGATAFGQQYTYTVPSSPQVRYISPNTQLWQYRSQAFSEGNVSDYYQYQAQYQALLQQQRLLQYQREQQRAYLQQYYSSLQCNQYNTGVKTMETRYPDPDYRQYTPKTQPNYPTYQSADDEPTYYHGN